MNHKSSSPKILIITTDEALRAELESALDDFEMRENRPNSALPLTPWRGNRFASQWEGEPKTSSPLGGIEGGLSLALVDSQTLPDLETLSFGDTPVIFIGESDAAATLLKNYPPGMSDVISRPVDPDILRGKVSLFLQLASLKRQLAYEKEAAEEFVHIISHDLKAPLRIISVMGEMLADFHTGSLDDEGREMLEMVAGNAKRMTALINGLQEYSRIGRGDESFEALDLQQLIVDCIDFIRLTTNHAISLEGNFPTVWGDEALLNQLFECLINNAVRHNPNPAGEVTVACVEADGMHRFRISDNGPGIAPKNHELIFQIFQTLAPKGRHAEHIGLGLPTAKKIVQLHGGQIWLESELGAGCAFYFTLPLLN